MYLEADYGGGRFRLLAAEVKKAKRLVLPFAAMAVTGNMPFQRNFVATDRWVDGAQVIIQQLGFVVDYYR